MKLQKQLIQHDPESGRWGDCWRTCIACLLDMDAADVPHFINSEADWKDNVGLIDKMRLWLKARGFNLVGLGMNANPEWARAAALWFGDARYILSGQSPNHEGVGHCVIGTGGFEVAWDPALSGKGLAGPYKDEHGNESYWLEFIVPHHKVAQPGAMPEIPMPEPARLDQSR